MTFSTWRPMFALALVWGLIGFVAIAAPAIGTGIPEEYWLVATGVDLERGEIKAGKRGAVFPPEESRFGYSRYHHHGTALFAVDSAAVDSRFVEVRARLTSGIASGRLEPRVARAYASWEREGSVGGAATFVAHLASDTTEPNMTQWRRAAHAWRGQLFEAAWLTGMIVFVSWPRPIRASVRYRAARWGIAPMLLFLPTILGYRSVGLSNLTTPPSVYEGLALVLLSPSRLVPATPLDHWLLAHAPRPLEALAQLPGEAMSWTTYGPFALPAGLAAYGVLLAGTVWARASFRTDRRSKQ